MARRLNVILARAAEAARPPSNPLPLSLLRAFWKAWRQERRELATWAPAENHARRLEEMARERFGTLPASFAGAGGARVTLRGATVEKGWPALNVTVWWPDGRREDATVSGGALAPPAWLGARA